MIELQRTGFFREMPHGEPTDPSLAEARNPAAGPHEDRVAAYLEAGHVHTAAAGPTRDVLDTGKLIGPPHYLTDGTFVWPGDLAHYVRTYHVRLAGPFIEHMLANGWAVPAGVDLATLALPRRPAAAADASTVQGELGAAWSSFVGAARDALDGPQGDKLRAQLAEMKGAVSKFFDSLVPPDSERRKRLAAEAEHVKAAIDQAGNDAARAAGDAADELRGSLEEAGERIRSRLSSSLRALGDWLDRPEAERTAQVQSFMSSLQSRLDAAVARQRDPKAEGVPAGDAPAASRDEPGKPDPDPGDKGGTN